MNRALIIAVSLACGGCATAVHERANPAGGPPLTSIWSSSNADEIQIVSASGATITIRKLDNSTGPKEAIRVWSILDLGRTVADTLGGLIGSVIDKAAGGK